jgi:deoxyribonuclease IV
VPPRKPSPVGAHVAVGSGLLSGGLAYARDVGAEAVQVFVSNPRGWAPTAGDPVKDSAFRAVCAQARMPVFVHATYLVNLGSPTEATRTKSVESLRGGLRRGRRIGARGVVFHAGSALDAGDRDEALLRVRELLLPVLCDLTEDDPDLVVELSAGGGGSLAATVEDLEPFLAAVESHPRLGVCLDTCHAFAAGHDLASPGGVRTTLNSLRKTVGSGRLKLVHANDSLDPCGSRRDRHASIGAGRIGLNPFAELFRHPVTRGIPVIIETPGKAADHAKDVAALKALRAG